MEIYLTNNFRDNYIKIILILFCVTEEINMSIIESKVCIKCGSVNIQLDKEKFVCGDCGLTFCVFNGGKKHP